VRLRIKPAGSTTAVTSRTSIRISVFGPCGCAREVVAYCRGPWCVLSFEAVAFLRQRGYRARRLEDGFPEWKTAGLPVGHGP
jgi:hypothetical protein